MEIKVTNEFGRILVEVEGIVKTIGNTVELKDKISSLLLSDPQKMIVIDFKDTFVIPSALIGSLQKFILGDKAKISVIARESQLYELLDNLCLIEQLKVTKQ